MVAINNISSFALEAPSASSGWYLPAVGQLVCLYNAYYAGESKVLASLSALENGALNTTSNRYYWSSTADTDTDPYSVYRVTFNAEETDYVGHSTGGPGQSARPMLTF